MGDMRRCLHNRHRCSASSGCKSGSQQMSVDVLLSQDRCCARNVVALIVFLWLTHMAAAHMRTHASAGEASSHHN